MNTNPSTSRKTSTVWTLSSSGRTNAQATCLIFYKGTNTVKYVSGKSERYYRAVGDFSIVDNDGRTLYDLMRVWYDTVEYSDMLTSDVRAQSKSFSWQEAAQNWRTPITGRRKR